MRGWQRILIVPVAFGMIGVLLVGALWAFQRKIIYQPDTSAPPPAHLVLPGAQDVTLHTDDGVQLQAWLVPAGAGADTYVDTGYAVLYAPGNGGNRQGRASIAALLADRGLTVLLLDYRGYGGNPGSPSESTNTLDLLAGVQALADAGFGLQRVVYFGESIGGGVVANAQVQQPPAGIVLRSPFTDLADVASRVLPWLPVRWLLKDTYPVVERLSQSDVPITVIYGDDDSIVPTALSKQVATAVPNLFEELEVDGDHNDEVMFGPQVADAVARLVADLAG